MLYFDESVTSLTQNGVNYRTTLTPQLPSGAAEQGDPIRALYSPSSKTRELVDQQYTWQMTPEQTEYCQQWIDDFDPLDRLVYTYNADGMPTGETTLRDLQAASDSNYTDLQPPPRHRFVDGQWQPDDGLLSEQLRAERDRRLLDAINVLERHERQTLYLQPLTLVDLDPKEQADYIQALCDVPQQAGFPREVEWPSAPLYGESEAGQE